MSSVCERSQQFLTDLMKIRPDTKLVIVFFVCLFCLFPKQIAAGSQTETEACRFNSQDYHSLWFLTFMMSYGFIFCSSI